MVGGVEKRGGFLPSLEERSRFFASVDTSITGAFVTKKLDSYLAVYVCIFRKVYLTHAATTDQANEPIPTKLHSFERHSVNFRKLNNVYLCHIHRCSTIFLVTSYH